MNQMLFKVFSVSNSCGHFIWLMILFAVRAILVEGLLRSIMQNYLEFGQAVQILFKYFILMSIISISAFLTGQYEEHL